MINKVLVIGLDGVPLSLIEGWVKEGLLPTFKQVMEEGATGLLESTIPPTSGPSWSSFMTGKNPGKTGIYDFLYRREGSYIFPPVNANRRDGKSLWRLLSEEGKRVGVVNLPISYPVEEVDGFLIAGWMTPYSARDFIYPPELYEELKREIGYYRIYPTETFAEERKEKFLKACDDLLEFRTRTNLYLMERYPWDLFMTVYFDTDRVLHQMWHYLDPTHPWRVGDGGEDKSGPVKRYFQKVDRAIGEIISRVDDDTLVFIMSDHGMGPAHNFIVLNNWLLDTGLLKLRDDPFRWFKRRLFRAGFTVRNVHRMADWFGLAKHAEYKGLYSMDYLMKLVFLSFLDVDWPRSKAYSFGRHLGSIYINLRGREPEGAVAPEDYEAVREEIVQLAKEFVDPQTGEPLIGQILRKEEIYHGPHLDRAPDLILRPKDVTNIFFGLADFGSNMTVDTVYRYSGMHRDHGMVMMKGKAVRKGARIEGANIVDLAPTMLYVLGLPIPQDMDGRPLRAAFQEEYVEAMPLAYNEVGSSTGSKDTGYTEEEEREIQERLRSLGYLG